MKLNWAERWVVNNPSRVVQQTIEAKWFKRMMPLKPGASILEFGCGRGAGAKLIQKNFKPALLLAQDLDLGMLRKATHYLTRNEREKISLSVADIIEIPFKDESFDAVFGFGVLHHVPHWQKSLLEIARVLKAGGIYYIEELYPALYMNFITRHLLLHPEENRFKSNDLKKTMQQAGLPIKKAIELKNIGILGVAVKG